MAEKSSTMVKYTVVGVAVIVAWGESYQIFGSLNSSPWTLRNFGADEAKAVSAKGYVAKAWVNNFLMGAVGSILLKLADESGWWLPFVVTNAVSAYMTYEYHQALNEAMKDDSKGWEKE